MYDIIDISRYFVGKDNELTEIQIQKLVYYAYCWYIIVNNSNKNNISKKLFKERPEAWIHGPVFRTLYNKMKCDKNLFLLDDKYNNSLNDDIKSFLDKIFDVYGKYSGNQLEEIAKSETPWIIARNGLSNKVKSKNKINDIVIYQYYKN